MTDLLTNILPYIPQSALPIIICVCFYFYIQSKRKETKVERDNDSRQIHDDILKLQFKVSNLEGNSQHHEEILEDLRNQLNILNTNITRLSVIIEEMNKRTE